MGHPHTVKQCGQCRQLKSVDQFYPSNRGTHKRDGYCKVCRQARDRARSANRSKAVLAKKAKDPTYYRNKKLLKMYGITQEQYEAMHAAQGGVCAICNQPETRILYGAVAYLAVDHDHQTGAVRALLCHRCNVGLGRVEDADFLRRALAYLAHHRERAEEAVRAGRAAQGSLL